MKACSGWLAAGLFCCIILAASGCGGNKQVSDQKPVANSSNSPANQAANSSSAGVHITDLYATKGNAQGGLGERAASFQPSDRTIFAVARLSEPVAGTKIRFVWYAVDAGGADNEEIEEAEYTTQPAERDVSAHLTFKEDWPPGHYKLEAYVNGKLEKTVEYTVQ